ncbi:MAG: hypothetical protein M3203_07820 [Actinomycetota bacterium]|nr:hypothetical protein [Actinomycetota bacterium]
MESRSTEREARLEQTLEAVAGRLSEHVASVTVSAGDARARLDALERELRGETSALAASIDVLRSEVVEAAAETARLVREVEADLKALRSEVLTAVADQVEARTEALERDVAREAALETRLRRDLDDLVSTELANVREGNDEQHPLTERIDRVDSQVGALAGELAALRLQLSSTEAKLDERLVPLAEQLSETSSTREALVSSARANAAELAALRIELRDEMTRLSDSLDVQRAETASRVELTAFEKELEERVAEELTSARSQLDARLVTLDAVVDAVDAAAASLEAGLEERLTGVANVAASSALAPVRSDLRSVHAEVAATQRSIRELRRRVRTSLPPQVPSVEDKAASAAVVPKRLIPTTARRPNRSA